MSCEIISSADLQQGRGCLFSTHFSEGNTDASESFTLWLVCFFFHPSICCLQFIRLCRLPALARRSEWVN